MVNAHFYKLHDQKNPCFLCAGNQFIGKEWFYFKNKGHTEKAFREKVKTESKTDSHQTKLVMEEESSLRSNEDLCSIFQVSKPKPTPLLKIKIIVNETPVQMEVDTGASISLLNFNTYNALKAEENELLPTFG